LAEVLLNRQSELKQSVGSSGFGENQFSVNSSEAERRFLGVEGVDHINHRSALVLAARMGCRDKLRTLKT
jgi:hypothetical protein